MKNTTLIKGVGLLATVIGFIADIVSDWADDEETEAMVDRKIAEALARQSTPPVRTVKTTHTTHKKRRTHR